MTASLRGPLGGARVVTSAPRNGGPYVTTPPAELGADVVAVERPRTRDGARAQYPEPEPGPPPEPGAHTASLLREPDDPSPHPEEVQP
nr:CoA transferase [Microtetraspora fusca]